jgi:hypothetical protein
MPIKHTPIKAVITHQGAIEVDKLGPPTCWAEETSDSIMLLYLDCDSKYPGILTDGEHEGVPELSLYASKTTIKLKEGVDRDLPTTLIFPDLTGWKIKMCQVTGRYTVALCLTYHPTDAENVPTNAE